MMPTMTQILMAAFVQIFCRHLPSVAIWTQKLQVIIKDRIIRRLHMDLTEIKSQYSNCYAEVMKQDKVLDTLRELLDHLKTEIVNLEQDIRLMELHFAEKLEVLHLSKTRELEKLTAESQKGNESCKNTVESLNGKVSFLNNLLKEKSEVLARIEADKEVLQNAAGQYSSLMAEANQEKANLKLEIKDLQGQLEKFEVNYQCAMEDGKKYQDMILEAANREVRLQKEFTEKERQVLEKLRSSRTEELRMCDVVDILNTELLNIKTELAEREAQLQSVACQNHLSTHTIEKLQKDLELKDATIDCLQGNMNEMNLNLVTTIKMLKGKEQLVQNLQSQISELQRQLESESLRSAVCEEVHTLEMEALRLKSQVKRCTQLQDGMNVEVRECPSVPETWWWDDFWQM